MLVLSRKKEQSVVIGVSEAGERMVKVTVLEIRGAQVKLGFEADKDVPVHRWEVWEQTRTNGNGGQASHDARQNETAGDRYGE